MIESDLRKFGIVDKDGGPRDSLRMRFDRLPRDLVWFLAGTFVFALLFPTIAWAAQQAANVDVVGALTLAWSAYQKHGYVVAGACLVGLAVALAKAGWFGGWVAKVPAKYRPVLALGVGVLGMVAAELQQGMDWREAILHGLEALGLAVFGHQAVVEGMRGGKEIVPQSPWSPKVPPASLVPPVPPAS